MRLLLTLLSILGATPVERPHEDAAVLIEVTTAEVEIRGRVLRLADFARIEVLGAPDTSKAQAARLGLMDLVHFDGAASTASIDHAAIRRAVVSAGFPTDNVSITGPERVEVRQRRIRIATSRIEAAARRHVMEALGSEAEDAEIRMAGPPAAIEVPAARYRMEIECDGDPRNPRYVGLCRLEIRVVVDGETVLREPVAVIVKREVSVAKLRRGIQKGRALGIDDVEIVKLSIDGGDSSFVTSLSSVLGRKAVRNLESGAVLLDLDLQALPIIAKGDVITARIRVGGLIAETLVRAEQEGGRGERIALTNLESSRPLQGTIIDARTVEIESTQPVEKK